MRAKWHERSVLFHITKDKIVHKFKFFFLFGVKMGDRDSTHTRLNFGITYK